MIKDMNLKCTAIKRDCTACERIATNQLKNNHYRQLFCTLHTNKRLKEHPKDKVVVDKEKITCCYHLRLGSVNKNKGRTRCNKKATYVVKIGSVFCTQHYKKYNIVWGEIGTLLKNK